MRFKIRVTGGDRTYRIDFTIWTSDYQKVIEIQRYSNKHKYQITIEVIE